MSFHETDKMICCTNLELQEGQDMPCCEDSQEIMNCEMEDCQCDLAISISSFTLVFTQEEKTIVQLTEHNFPLLVNHLQSPLFPIWSPPDIA